MKVDDVLEDDELRLVDVLLEEELLATAPPQRRANSLPRWLAAAIVLLGIGVVLGVAVLHPREAGAPQTGQGRQCVPLSPTEAVERLGDPRKREKLIASVRTIRLELMGSLDQTAGLGGEVVGECEVHDAAAVAELGALLQRAFDAVEIDAPATIEEDAMASLVDDRRGTSRVVCECADGRSLVLWAALGDRRSQPALSALRIRVHMDDGSVLAGRLRALEHAAEEATRRLHGSARRANELADLPLSLRALRCRYFTAADFASLQRLPALETLTVSDSVGGGPYRGPIGPRPEDAFTTSAARGVATLTAVQRLEVPADELDDDALRAFARMPTLRSLTLTGSIERITGAGFAAFGGQLEVLRIVENRGVPLRAEQLRAIAALLRLRELWICMSADDGEAAACIVSMPALRRLAIAGYRAQNSDALLGAIARTRVERLMLRDMVVSRDGLAALSGLPTLREADVRFLDLDSAEVLAALSSWHQVRRLDVRGTGLASPAVEDLRLSLPSCTILASPSGIGRVTSLQFGPPSWTRD